MKLLKKNILKYRTQEEIWKIPNIKLIYRIIISNINHTPTNALRHPTSNWDLIWNNYTKGLSSRRGKIGPVKSYFRNV